MKEEKTMSKFWEPAAFRAAEGRVWGSMWGRWGIRHARGRRYVVYLIDGARLTEFDSLAHARRFCEAIDGLTDWLRPVAEIGADFELGLALHRAALRITGGRPDLRII
jgi:hypothetical protein